MRKGDNLTKIARHFRTSVQALTRANNIRNPNRIFAGQALCIR
ncbi:MAG: LysM peptidoglycan-binding domain-containing protein [Caldilineaceae bacterium]|nr:LysM peptidoglycan-binding domain-containing protein [Caldilineaceae bacterium]